MTTFDLNSFTSALGDTNSVTSGVDFSGKSLKLDTEKDAKPIIEAINTCPNLRYLTLTGNTLGVAAAEAIAKALENHPEFNVARFSDMFTGRMKTEIPPALRALGDGMIVAGARLTTLELSDNAFGPIGVEGLAKLLQSDVCSQLQELRLNNNGLGTSGGRLLAGALRGCGRLRVFVAGRNRLENDGAAALAKVFQGLGSLEEISLPQNGIYHAGVAALAAALPGNPALRALNLNDNTIGPKGAAAIARALPKLKNLKSINFGDCLLKSKGAETLAKAFQENDLQLESVDVSNNEIGRVACARLVDALAQTPARHALRTLLLAGNSLGNSAHKKMLKDKLGSCVELSDGEESDEDGSDGESDEESETEESEEESEDSDHSEIDDSARLAEPFSLDTTGEEEVVDAVERFLQQPSAEHLARLGEHPHAVIDAQLQTVAEVGGRTQQYVEAWACAAGLGADRPAADLLATALRRAPSAWLLADAMLRALSLIKSENKQYQIRWRLAPCFSALAENFSTLPAPLRDTLKFFISTKLPVLAPDVRDTIQMYPQLYQ